MGGFERYPRTRALAGQHGPAAVRAAATAARARPDVAAAIEAVLGAVDGVARDVAARAILEAWQMLTAERPALRAVPPPAQAVRSA